MELPTWKQEQTSLEAGADRIRSKKRQDWKQEQIGLEAGADWVVSRSHAT